MYCNNAGLCIHQSLVMNNYNQSIAIDPVGLSVNLLQYLYSGEIILSRNQSARLFCTKYNYGHVYRMMFTRPFQTCERKPSLLPFVPGRSFGYVESCNISENNNFLRIRNQIHFRLILPIFFRKCIIRRYL